MIGVLSEALIAKSRPTRPLDHIAAFLRTVIATGLPIHVIVFPPRPSLLQLLAPIIFSSRTRIAPGEMIVMETVVLIDGHPIPASRAIGHCLVDALADFK